MNKLTKEQERFLAERCEDRSNNKIFVPSYVIKKYCELTHSYPSNSEAIQIIGNFYADYRKEMPDVDFTI